MTSDTGIVAPARRFARGLAALGLALAFCAAPLANLAAAPPPLAIFAPTEGAVVTPGRTITVRWTGGDPSMSMDILLIDVTPNTSVAIVAHGIPNNGAYDWTFPSSLPFDGPGGHTYQFYVQDVGPNTTTWAYGPRFTAGGAGGVWTTKAPMPTARVDFGMAAALNGRLYVVGGQNGVTNLSNNEVYDPATDSWETKAPPSAPVVNSCVGVVDGILYVVGGNRSGGTSIDNTDGLLAYDPLSDLWTSRTPMSRKRSHFAAAAVGGKLYAIGGFGSPGANDWLASVEAYDPQTNAWTPRASLPTPRRDHVAAVVDGRIYVVAGTFPSDPNGQTPLPVDVYDPETNTWVRTATMPTARNWPMVAGSGGLLYVAGGSYSEALKTVDVYDSALDSWRTAPEMNTPHHRGGAATIGGTVYVVGGNAPTVSGVSDVLEAFTPAPPVCVQPPSGLVGWWPLDGSTRDVVSGIAGVGEGTIAYETGRVGQGFRADLGAINAGHRGALSVSNADFTVEMWLRYGGTCPGGCNQPLVTKVKDGAIWNGDGWQWYLAGGRVTFCFGGFMFTWGPELPTNAWSHLVVVHRRSPGGGFDSSMYLNGVLATASTSTGTATSIHLDTPPESDASDLRIGGGRQNSGQPDDPHLIDEVALYDRALSAAEIRSHFDAGSAGMCKLTSVVVTPPTATRNVGQTQQFTATGTFSDGSSRALAGGTDTWAALPPIPTPRTGPMAASVGGRLYVIGGHPVQAGPPTGANEMFDPEAGTWTARASMPIPRLSSAIGVIDGKIYVAGGYTGDFATSDLQVYDPETNTWAVKAPMPTPRWTCSGGVADGKLYVIGGMQDYPGLHDYPSAKVECYDPATNLWTTKAPMILPRSHLSSVAGRIGGKLYVAGGYQGPPAVSTGQHVATCEAYDVAADAWSSVAPMPSARIVPGEEVVNGLLYVVSGTYLDTRSRAVETFDPSTNSWSSRAPSPTSHFGPATAVLDGRLVVAGAGEDNSASSVVEAYTPHGEVDWTSGVDGAVGYWPGEGNAKDVAGGNDGRLLGGASFASGKVGLGFRFPNNGDGVTIHHRDVLDIRSPGFTADFWVRGADDDRAQVHFLLDKTPSLSGDRTGWAFMLSADGGGLMFSIGDAMTGGYNNVFATSRLLDGEFHHVTGTWDGSVIRLYVDGVQLSAGQISMPANNTRDLSIGFTWGDGEPQRFFHGVVDEIRIYGRAISVSEIQAIQAVPPTGVATVDAFGLATALAAGATTITATTPAGASSSGTLTVVAGDVNAPLVTIDSPVAGSVVYGPAGTAAAVMAHVDDLSATTVVSTPAGVGASLPAGGGVVTGAVSLNEGANTIAVAATDSSGNTGTASVTVSLDTTPPAFDGTPGDVTAEATGASGAVVAFATPTATDALGADVAVICSPGSGATFPLGTTTVTCTATDARGSTTSQSFQVTVRDTTAPSLVVADVGPIEATGASGAVVNFALSASDLVDGAVAVMCVPASGSTFPLGTTTVSCTATDAHGNVAAWTFRVIVRDTTPPSLTVADIGPVEATGPSGAVAMFTPTATDTVSTPTVVCSPDSGTTFAIGRTTVNCTATDGAGNAAIRPFQVTVVDTTPPAITVPADITAEATSPAGAAVAFTATAADLVDGAVTVSCSPPSGSTFAVGATTVSCSATDARGNTASASFQVTVVDTTPPTVAVPADITAEATSSAGAAVAFATTATDLVDGAVTPTCSFAPGSTFALGTTSVTCAATDAHGNTAASSFNVTVEDTTAPTIAVPAAITVEATISAGVAVTFAATASDLVDGAVAVTCSPVSGSVFPIGTTTVTCSATDVHGNAATITFDVMVNDVSPPTIGVPADITAEANGPSGATVTFAATTLDLVDGAATAACSPVSGSTFPIGTTTVTCTATDSHGNTATATFRVTVRDLTPPTLGVPADVTAEAIGPAGAVVAFSATATDVVDGSVAVSCSPASGSTFPLGTTTVSCTATDAHGNATAASFAVTVGDTTTPAISGVPGDITVLTSSASGAVVSYAPPTATDLVDGVVAVICSKVTGSTFAVGTTTVQCSATDAHGNIGSAQFNVIVQTLNLATLALTLQVNAAALPANAKTDLNASLSAAAAAFDRGNSTAGANQLRAFENKVNAQTGKTIDAATAASLIAAAEKILAASGK